MDQSSFRIFSSPVKAWTAVSACALLLLLAPGLMLRVYLWAFNSIGEAGMSTALTLVFGLVGALLLLWARPRRLGSYVALAFVAAGVLYFFQGIQQPSNRLHLIQYGALTLLIYDALRFHCRNRFLYVWTLALSFLIGIADESIQSVAGRVFDTHDLALNALAALFSLAIIGFLFAPSSQSLTQDGPG